MDHRKQQESYRKTSSFASLTRLKPLNVWITTICGKFLKRWEYQTPYLPTEKPVCRSRSIQQLKLDMEQHTGSKLGNKYIKPVYFHPTYLTFMQSTLCKNWTWWSTSWNQDWWDKYQSLQICKRHHPYDRKWRVIKEALDEGERGEWKTWLKTQR